MLQALLLARHAAGIFPLHACILVECDACGLKLVLCFQAWLEGWHRDWRPFKEFGRSGSAELSLRTPPQSVSARRLPHTSAGDRVQVVKLHATYGFEVGRVCNAQLLSFAHERIPAIAEYTAVHAMASLSLRIGSNRFR